MLRMSFLTPFKTPRPSFFSITQISFASAYGTIFPLLGPFTNKCSRLSKHSMGKVKKMQNLMVVIDASLILTKLSSIEDLVKLHVPYATIFHVFLAALRQSCPSQCTCFSPPPLKMPFPNYAKHISRWSLSLHWLHKSMRVKNTLEEESRGKCGAEQGHKGLAALLKSSKGNCFISCVHCMLL